MMYAYRLHSPDPDLDGEELAFYANSPAEVVAMAAAWLAAEQMPEGTRLERIEKNSGGTGGRS